MKMEKAGIIGVGLIGASFARCVKKGGIDVVGFGRKKETLDKAISLGIVDRISEKLSEIQECDLVIIATPVMSVISVMENIAPYVKEGAVISDVGSVKTPIVLKGEEIFSGRSFFVGGHPIAGTEYSGPEASYEGLFSGKKMILTPTENTNLQAKAVLKKLWEETGATVMEMPPRVHDEIFSYVSHLPHMVAYSLVNAIANSSVDGFKAIDFSAGGFKDITRIASSSPEMWRDIALMNKDNIIRAIEGFEKEIAVLKKLIESENDGILSFFQNAKNTRDRID